MNILPKKKWHVRTKENVARVRRDQKKASEAEKRVAERAQLAEQEYKVNLLRRNAQRMDAIYWDGKSKVDDNNMQFNNFSSHINLFADLEAEHRKNVGLGNRDYELEKKNEQEEYEKKVGILQYLGQGSSELAKDFQDKPWYEKLPARKEAKKLETPVKKENESIKSDIRPAKILSKCVEHKKKSEDKKSRHKKRRKKGKHHDSSKTSSSEEKSPDCEEILRKQKLEKLREERLDREAKERKRLANLLMPSESNKEDKGRIVAKYNSQFNPMLARQNKAVQL